MRLLLLSLLMTCSPLLLHAEQTREITSFLASRELVGQVFFADRSAKLTVEAKSELNKLVAQLRAYLRQDRLLRIEGFSGAKEDSQSDSKLSLRRALAVKNYLAKGHQLQLNIYLTGFADNRVDDGQRINGNRVDIAIYEMNSAAQHLFDESEQSERYDMQ